MNSKKTKKELSTIKILMIGVLAAVIEFPILYFLIPCTTVGFFIHLAIFISIFMVLLSYFSNRLNKKEKIKDKSVVKEPTIYKCSRYVEPTRYVEPKEVHN